MAKLLSDSDVSQYLSNRQIAGRKANAHSLARMGSWEAEQELRNQEKAYQYQPSDRRREIRIIDDSKSWLPQSHYGRKRAKKPRQYPTKAFAGDCIGYRIPPGKPYPLEFPVLKYAEFVEKGLITKAEMIRLVRIVILVSRGGKKNVDSVRKSSRVSVGKLPQG